MAVATEPALKSRKLTLEHRKAISKGQIARHKRNRLAQKSEPLLKRCTKCGEWKSRKYDFLQRVRKLASGEIRLYPAGECRECTNKRAAKHREKLRREGVLQQKEREWNSHRDRERRNAYNREYGRMQRILNGATPRGPWKKYRHEIKLDSLPRELDSVAVAAYFDRFLTIEEHSGNHCINRIAISQTDSHRLNRWRKGIPRRLTERQVDEISTRYDLPPWEAIEAGKIAA